VSPAPFLKHHLRNGGVQVNYSRLKFTIREVIKIFDVISRDPSRRTKNPAYWASKLSRGHFPGRSVHSVNNQWQKFSVHGTKDDAIKQALKLKMAYSLNFP